MYKVIVYQSYCSRIEISVFVIQYPWRLNWNSGVATIRHYYIHYYIPLYRQPWEIISVNPLRSESMWRGTWGETAEKFCWPRRGELGHNLCGTSLFTSPSNRANWKLGAGYWTEPEQSHFLCHVSMHLPTAWPNCHRSDTTGACYLEMDSILHYISNTAKCNWVSCMYPGHVLVSLYFSYSKHGRQELRRNRHLPVFDFVCFLHCIYVHPDLVFHMWWKTACYRLYIWKNHTSPEFVFL